MLISKKERDSLYQIEYRSKHVDILKKKRRIYQSTLKLIKAKERYRDYLNSKETQANIVYIIKPPFKTYKKNSDQVA